MKNGKNMGTGKAGFIRRAGKQEHERKREEMLTTDGQDEHGWEKTMNSRKLRKRRRKRAATDETRSVNPIQNTHKIAKSIVKPR